MPRIILRLNEILPLAGKGLDVNALRTKMDQDNNYRHELAKKYAMKHMLHNGATLEFPADGYRNHNLLFWDAQNEEIVEPFTEIDDYGSVPPRFVVGDGYFNPGDWLDEVDHNSYVFPARPLINEMKEFAFEYPNEKKMIITMNGGDYTVYYNPSDMKDQWDSCVLEVHGETIEVFPGEPEWRETIVDELEESSNIEELRASNIILTNMVKKLTAKVIDLTSNLEELSTRLNMGLNNVSVV